MSQQSAHSIPVTVRRRASYRSSSCTSPINSRSYASFIESPAISFLSMLSEKVNPDNNTCENYDTGDVVHHYTLVSTLGHGAFSSVHSASFMNPDTHQHSDQTVAIKILKKPAQETFDPKSFRVLQHLYNETQLWGQLEHPSIIKMYQVMESTDAIFVVSEQAELNLFRYCELKSWVPLEDAKRLFRQIVEAVGYMHSQNIVHRDIKAENILLVCIERPLVEIPAALFKIDPFKAPVELAAKPQALRRASTQRSRPKMTMSPTQTRTELSNAASSARTSTSSEALTNLGITVDADFMVKALSPRVQPCVSGLAQLKHLSLDTDLAHVADSAMIPLSTSLSFEYEDRERLGSDTPFLQRANSLECSSPEEVFMMSSVLADPSYDALDPHIHKSTKKDKYGKDDPFENEINHAPVERERQIDITKLCAKLGDFGLAKRITDVEAKDEPGFCVGSLHYCSPEEVQGTSNRKPSGDVWSLGCVLYAMITGKLPFDDDFVPRLQYAIINGRFDRESFEKHAGVEGGELIRRILEVDEKKRAGIQEILDHVWLRI